MTPTSDLTIRNIVLKPLPNEMRRWGTLQRRDIPQMGDHHFAPRDACGRKRSPAAVATFRRGVSPNSKGKKYPPTPYSDNEVLYLLRVIDKDFPDTPAWKRLHAWMGFVWRSGLRISESLDLIAADLDEKTGSVIVQHGKGDKRGISGMDDWGWKHIAPWLEIRRTLPNPAAHIFCVCEGSTAGERWSPSGLRAMLAKVKTEAMFEKRLAPHQFRHTHAIGLRRDGISIDLVSRQLRHENLMTTSLYFRGVSNDEVVAAAMSRPAPGSSTAPAGSAPLDLSQFDPALIAAALALLTSSGASS